MPIADIVVGILGYPNVGKSSIINGLAHKKKAKVSKKAGTTHGMHWVRISDDIKIILWNDGRSNAQMFYCQGL